MGHRCGYVGIPKGHPWFNLDTQHIGDNDACYVCGREAPEEWRGNIKVHGGLSWGKIEGDTYVVGFACDTTSDLADPALNREKGKRDADDYQRLPQSWERSVKTTEFCVDECKKLCQAIQAKWEKASV